MRSELDGRAAKSMELRQASECEELHAATWPIYQALLLGCLGLIIFLAVSFVMGTSVPRDELTPGFAQTETIVMCLATLGVGWVFLGLTHRFPVTRFLESISWRESTRSMLLWSVVGLCAALVVQRLPGFVPHQHSLGFAFNFVVGTVGLHPLIEELYFRGILFESLSNRIDYRLAITIVSVAFVLLHTTSHPWTLVPATLILALVRIATRSTANCFAFHASYNLGILLWDFILTSHFN